MNNTNKLPKCVGFIMDGNRRYAESLGQEPVMGHVAGKEAFLNMVEHVLELGIQHAIFYTFSTENWKRSQSEVESLLGLFRQVLTEMKETTKERCAIRIVGRWKDFPEDIQESFLNLEADTAEYANRGTIWVALSYGGRAELTAAFVELVASGEEVSEESIAAHLWTAGMPDPDLIIRTGGEQRLSNFLPWQSVYSELFFTETYWPAFTKDEFTRILSAYEDRERRIGK
jgi:undecaprenyl diphosphate synthase